MEQALKDTARWYAVHVKSRHEFRVYERLTGAGITTFLPSLKRLSKWKDRNKLIQFPLFQGYLFVQTDNSHDARLTILKTPGVVRILGTVTGEPEPIPEEQIQSLMKLIDAGAHLDPYPYLQEGQRIRIKRGPLAGIEGLLVEKSGQHKLVLSVDILCQSTSVTIQASDVERI
jgi:transcription termination/antitermination protein NusG